MERGQTLREYGGPFLLACLFLGLVFGYVVLKPFLMIFLMAFVLATISQPAYGWLLRRTRGRARLSAAITCVLLVVVIIVPCMLLFTVLAQQSVQAYVWVSDKIQAALHDQNLINQGLDLAKRIIPGLDVTPKDVAQALTGLAGNLSGFLVSLSGSVVKAVTTAIWQFLLMLFVLFYFLKDGGALLRWIMHLTPLPGSLQQELFDRFKAVSESAFYGVFLTAICQGILGGIGFLIVGLQPLVWGVVMAFFSLVPLVGTTLVAIQLLLIPPIMMVSQKVRQPGLLKCGCRSYRGRSNVWFQEQKLLICKKVAL